MCENSLYLVCTSLLLCVAQQGYILRIISGCLQKNSPKSVTGSTVAAVATPSIMGGTADRPAQLELCIARTERVLLL